MSYPALFNLKSNPFRLTPAVSAEEIFWAGFPEIKTEFETLIKRAIRIPNSSLVLNWGEYGSGKTHAARYFGKADVLTSLAQDAGAPAPYMIFINLPKGKNPTDDLYISVIDKLDVAQLRQQFAGNLQAINNYIDGIGDNNYVKAVLKAIFDAACPLDLLKRYLYQSTTATENRELVPFGIMRPISSDNDQSKILAGLFSCITFEKAVYSSMILWIDEFEDIAIMSKVNADKTNSFLRDIIDNTPNNLLILLNLTQSALFNIEDLGQYLSEAVKSRIRRRINFDLPKQVQIFEYIRELLAYYRVNDQEQGRIDLFPFEQDALETVLADLDNASLRSINETLGLLLDLAELDGTAPITAAYYATNKADVLGDWKN